MKHRNFLPLLILVTLLSGCSTQKPATTTAVLGPHEEAQHENDLFLKQKTYDPWLLTSPDAAPTVPAYLPIGSTGQVYDLTGRAVQTFHGGAYTKGVIVNESQPMKASPIEAPSLNLQTGVLDIGSGASAGTVGGAGSGQTDWPSFWKKSDIDILGDPEAQQVTHAELFYLCGSAAAGTDHSIPPMGLSSTVYLGHIFWDAEIWMMPAFLPQHPELAKSIVDYRFDRLGAAEKLAKEHGFAGAEYPWESAATGLEEAPVEFSHERHITADVAYASWQYYLWTGDKSFLSKEGWPVLSATANYWVSRVKLGLDGKYHIDFVIGPDENAGEVTDNAWTNAMAQYNLNAAVTAARDTGNPVNPKWADVAGKMFIPYDSKAQLFLEYPQFDLARGEAKQADTQMLIYPLNFPMMQAAANNTLDYYLQHTIQFGPAMTSSINAIVAAKLGRAQQSLDLYHDSYRPFMRGPWDAFSEKRTKSDVYFTTGMGGNLQVVLYGFAGLNIACGDQKGKGVLAAKHGDAVLYVDPHLPPGWTELQVKGINFRGTTYKVDIKAGNSVTITNEGGSSLSQAL